jgi:hypothetical protein
MSAANDGFEPKVTYAARSTNVSFGGIGEIVHF